MFGLLPRVVDWACCLVSRLLWLTSWLFGWMGLSLCLCGLCLGVGWWLDCFAF